MSLNPSAPPSTVKQCPRCGLVADLHAPNCTNCGRVYNTKFPVAPPPPAAPNYAPPSPPQLRPPAYAAPPVAAPNQTDAAPSSHPSAFLLGECARQYRALNGILIAGALVLFFGPALFFLSLLIVLLFLNPLTIGVVATIGVAMIVYALIQRPALRRRVAELGVDPLAWERSLYPPGYWQRVILVCVCVVVALVAGFGILAAIGKRSRQEAAPTERLQPGESPSYDFRTDPNNYPQPGRTPPSRQ